MPRRPVVSGREAVAAFRRAGWQISRRVGDHVIMEKEGMAATLSVPQHKELRPGTLHVLLKNAHLRADEFRQLL
jgi:predicted RNA binding protein YcfA (HicA-like mRNA interferase family)